MGPGRSMVLWCSANNSVCVWSAWVCRVCGVHKEGELGESKKGRLRNSTLGCANRLESTATKHKFRLAHKRRCQPQSHSNKHSQFAVRDAWQRHRQQLLRELCGLLTHDVQAHQEVAAAAGQQQHTAVRRPRSTCLL